MMTFTEAVRAVFGKYATFSGRARRSEFWWWVLFGLLVTVVALSIDMLVIAPMLGFHPFDENAAEPLGLVVALALFIPDLSVSIRRLHDINRSGWWLLLMFVPIVGWLLLLYWNCQRGTEGENSFGSDPLAVTTDTTPS